MLAAALLLTGCGATPDDAGTLTPLNPVDPAVVRAILDWFVAHKSLNWRTAAEGRTRRFDEHKGFFVVRRARWLLAHGPASWGTETNHTTVIARIDSEYTALEAYATAKLSTPGHPGPLTGGGGDVSPPHLDLADVARRRTSDPATTMAQALASRDNSVKQRTVDFLTERRERAMMIVWRAGGIHFDLWTPSADQHTATLRQAAMDEILDRRLHAAERMSYQISRADAMGASSLDTSAGAHGPWTDGLRIRMFEYPRLDASAVPAVAPVADENRSPPGREWHWESARHRRIVYNVAPGHRFRSAAAPGFPLVAGDDYLHQLQASPGLTPAQAIDALYTPSTNYWDRSWIYCDHVVSSLHLQALLFAKRRRTHGDAAFDDLVTGHAAGYVQLGPLLRHVSGALGPGLLMDSGPEPDPDIDPPPTPPDPAFHNALTPPADIEVGDHLIFWNSVLYPLVSNGEWQLENALVVGVESDPEAGSIKLQRMRMQGHGTTPLTVGGYERMIGRHLATGMADARDDASHAASTVSALAFNGAADRLVRWAPYPDTWTPPGAWWVRVPVRHETHATVRERLRKGVIPDPAYPNPAPFTDSVYFPLWEPQYRDGWAGYLADRAAGPVRVSPRLRSVPADGSVIPGLHYIGGTWDPLPIVRPRVTP